jgi:hypothetical protein
VAVLQNGTTQVLQTRNYNPGTFTSPALDMQVGQSKVTMAADRNSWPDTGSDVIKVLFEVSLDGGTNWQLLGAFIAAGGTVINPWTQQPQTQSTFTVDVPQPDNTTRQIRASATVFSRINTAVSITVS